MKEAIKAALRAQNITLSDKRVLIALSGGADSVSLLLVLKELCREVLALHVNHGIRGDESDADARFCRKLCEELDVPFFLEECDIPRLAAERKEGLELCAREVRYSLFSRYMEAHSLDYTATGHTKNDRAETLLFHLARGSGLRGLAGIPFVRGSILRPLLHTSRAEIEAYLQQQEQVFVTDSTNNDHRYSRNYIRHILIPDFAEINPSFLDAASRCADLLALDLLHFTALAKAAIMEVAPIDGGLCIPCAALENLPPTALHEALLLLAPQSPLSAAQTEQLTSLLKSPSPSAQINAGNGLILRRCYTFLHILTEEAAPAAPFCTPLLLGENYVRTPTGQKIIKISKEQQKVHNFDNYFLIDCAILNEGLFARSRREGDSCKTLGGTKSVKKLLIDRKVPKFTRDTLLCIAAGSRVVALEGCGTLFPKAAGKEVVSIEIINAACEQPETPSGKKENLRTAKEGDKK